MSPVYPFLQIGSHAFEMSEESSKPLGAQTRHPELLLCLLARACLSAVNAALTLPHPPVEPFSSPFYLIPMSLLCAPLPPSSTPHGFLSIDSECTETRAGRLLQSLSSAR